MGHLNDDRYFVSSSFPSMKKTGKPPAAPSMDMDGMMPPPPPPKKPKKKAKNSGTKKEDGKKKATKKTEL